MLNAGGPWVLVDLSNLCRDDRLCRSGRRADLGALRDFTKALDAHPAKFGSMRAIADNSLKRYLEPDDRAELQRLADAKLVISTPSADDTLFEAAFSEASPFRGALIASTDNFADFRIAYPEIQGSKNRFLEWSKQPNGKLKVSFRDMGHFTHMRISRKVEEGEFKQRRIFHTTVRDRAVNFRYRCKYKGCIQAQLWPEGLPQMPEYDRRDDSFCCPGCGSRLELVGTRPPTAQLVISVGGTEACRLLLEDGEAVVVGRDDRKGCVGLANYLPDDVAAELSRMHAKASFVDGVAQIEDFGSKNGTWLETRKGKFDRRRLRKGERVTLSRTSRVRLAGDVLVELSGRKNPFDGVRLGAQHTRMDADVRQTVTGG